MTECINSHSDAKKIRLKVKAETRMTASILTRSEHIKLKGSKECYLFGQKHICKNLHVVFLLLGKGDYSKNSLVFCLNK